LSYVGYGAQEVAVGAGDVVNVSLQSANNNMNEVVVIGYQTVRRRDLTGATSVVNTQSAQKNASRSLPEQLQGLAAGVAVRTGGAPGQEAVVRVRGLSTFSGSGSPLYIIDGMFSDPNTTVSPNDIETIQILKDASAAAIYGSRAANGVIIITTKRGKDGPMKVTASARYSASTIAKTYDMRPSLKDLGYQVDLDAADPYTVPAAGLRWDAGADTDVGRFVALHPDPGFLLV
jgi:TonB-dependent SusC/RagA subfamily outer membrane receptor